MKEIVKVKNISYQRYEELLIKKHTLKKEAEEYRQAYNKEFSELNTKVFEERIACIEKRKAISFCENLIKIGGIIYKSELDKYIEDVMSKYREALADLKDEDKKQLIRKNISDDELKEVKNIYHKIAKLIHPDMNQELKDNEVIQDLWNRTSIAYECYELNELQELNILVNNYLESINHAHNEIDIPNVNEKIFDLNNEIENIRNTDPYKFKYILKNKKSINIKKKELKKELKDCISYRKELETKLKEFKIV